MRWSPTRRSIVTRLVVSVVLISSIAVAVTGFVSTRLAEDATIDEVERLLDAQSRIADDLLVASLEADEWSDLEPLAARLEAETGLRIVLRPIGGGPAVVDSQGDLEPDERTPLRPERAQTLNPMTAIGSDPDAVGASLLLSDDALEVMAGLAGEVGVCLEQAGALAGWDTDETGLRFPLATDELIEQECLEQVFPMDDPGSPTDVFDSVLAPFLEPLPDVELFLGYSAEAQLAALGDGNDTLVIVGTLIVVVIAAAATWVIARRLLQPIGELTATARRLGGGDLGERADVERDDELGQLAEAFNDMADAIQSEDAHRRRLTSDIAHELRTPLANVSGYIEAAQDDVVPVDDALLQTLSEEAALMTHIVSDLQTLSLAESGTLRYDTEPIALAEAIGATVTAHEQRAHESGIALAAAKTEARVLGDARRVRQILTNLVENALRYTDAGGRVEVSVRSEGTVTRVDVADTGVGLAPADAARVFDRFYRVDASRTRASGGSGLGLAIAAEMARGMGGELTVDSTLGAGSTFTLTLPAAADF